MYECQRSEIFRRHIRSAINIWDFSDYLCRKLGKKIKFFGRIAYNLSMWDRLLVYNYIVQAHFVYCSSLFLNCTKKHIRRWKVLQNRCMRINLGCNRYNPIQYILDALKWLMLEKNIKKANLSVVYKMVNGSVPAYLTEMLQKAVCWMKFI